QPQEGEMGTEAEALRSAMPMELEKGVCYLVKEKKPELSFRLFEMLLAQKIPSLCITRQYPDRVRRERGLTDVRIIWLSHTPGEDYHNPTAIGTLAKVIQKFIEDNNGEGAVLLDGLEYLIINNGFLQTLMFVEHVNEFVMQRRAIILLPVSPDTLEEKELALLERNMKVLESPALKTDLESREVSRLLDNYCSWAGGPPSGRPTISSTRARNRSSFPFGIVAPDAMLWPPPFPETSDAASRSATAKSTPAAMCARVARAETFVTPSRTESPSVGRVGSKQHSIPVPATT